MKILFGIMIATLIAAESPRQVLLFYTDSGLTKQKSQMAILDAHQKDMIERDINVHKFPFSGKNLSAWKKWDIDSASSFTFILVGRDGGEKFRSSDVVSAEKLFGLIDAMPMRKSEVKRSRGNNPK
ncbi:DUF4174 domain-containing protein [Dyadobacter luticola]|uniref:DUF4174 domain-containing protein n=1 Tax=Dyadobacter luticola TaxID=1979387 RepID=A0A5R9L2S8_9BACT|nr:DUF4174 domain-containing protein [Dyadobacter luticola]TLV02884.1 DUF4174 domain-containing protein [Dyadobacter luticola]